MNAQSYVVPAHLLDSGDLGCRSRYVPKKSNQIDTRSDWLQISTVLSAFLTR